MPTDRKYEIVAELGEERDTEELVRTMEYLDNFTVISPSRQATDDLIAILKPVVRQQLTPGQTAAPVGAARHPGLPAVLQLVGPQTMLLSKWFVVAAALVILAGLAITNAGNGNPLLFLANASPVLGILSIFYEFRAKLSGVNELETACPYSPAQLATARLLVVLAYDILLCLAVTPVVGYWQGLVLWQVVVSWLGPLLLMLGIALAASLRLGIAGGCLVSTAVWALQLAVSEGQSLFSLLLPRQPLFTADFISLLTGTALILYAYKRWTRESMFMGD